MFLCNSTVSPINNRKEFTEIKVDQEVHIFSSDDFALHAAGAIAWRGIRNYNRSTETQTYASGQFVSPEHAITPQQVEDIISRFSISAIAAFDDHGPRYVVANQNIRPLLGQRLNVNWAWVLTLLAGICSCQLSALITLLARANKSIIRDNSYFSLVRLLGPVVDRIPKEEGANLKGDEIMNHPCLKGQKIKYGYRQGEDGIKEVGVSFLFAGLSYRSSTRSFPDGPYK